MFHIDVTNTQRTIDVDEDRLGQAARMVLADAGVVLGELSIAVVDDPTIHRLNVRHLGHDYPTDVLSFLLEEGEGSLEGELVVSAEAAAAEAPHYGWSARDELLLYVVHGTLHLVGYDDRDQAQRAEMRRREDEYLSRLGVIRRSDQPEPDSAPPLGSGATG